MNLKCDASWKSSTSSGNPTAFGRVVEEPEDEVDLAFDGRQVHIGVEADVPLTQRLRNGRDLLENVVGLGLQFPDAHGGLLQPRVLPGDCVGLLVPQLQVGQLAFEVRVPLSEFATERVDGVDQQHLLLAEQEEAFLLLGNLLDDDVED